MEHQTASPLPTTTTTTTTTNVRPTTPQVSSEYPTYSPRPSSSTPNALDSQGLYEKEQALMRWEQDLKNREQNLSTQQTAMSTATPVVVPPTTYQNNFPKFYPVTRFNIREDIPAAQHRVVKFAGFVFLYSCVALIYNFAVGIATLTIAGNVGNFFLSLFFMLIGIPFMFFVTKRYYRSVRDQQSPKKSYSAVVTYFGVLCLAFIFWIGFKHSGMNGLLWMINLFHNDHTAVGAMAVISMTFWFFAMFLVAGLLFKMLRHNNIKRQRGEMNYGGTREYLRTR
eukprot:gene7460-9166_t